MEVRLITKTSGVEGSEYYNRSIDDIIVGQARVSSSREINELFAEPEKLLRHCILNQHWSIFTLANLGFEIKTSRAIGREILRHGSMAGLTEFSQRYSESMSYEPIELRLQSKSNRQSSTEVITDEELRHEVNFAINSSRESYENLIKKGVAKECARFVLTENTSTTIYMNFRVRELITFLNARLHKTAQKEINMIAEIMRDIMIEQCPIISKALFNFEHAYDIHILERVVLEKYGLFDMIKDNNFKKIK